MDNHIVERIYASYLKSWKVTTDSRSIEPGCLFFALKGNSFDGNAFVGEALAQGAVLCVTSDKKYEEREGCVVVDDVLRTLQKVARYHRDHLQVPVIGITGTNGKTTTKELVASVLGKRYKVHATKGNYNNHLGVPLTILSTPKNCEILVVEMGANHPGEIAELCEIANPGYGLITSVGKAHLEGFGSFDGVVRTKTELYNHLAKNRGKIFVSTDNEILYREAKERENIGAQLITYGTTLSDVIGTYKGADPYMSFYTEIGDNVYNISTKLFGGYNFHNAMAALAVGRYFNVEMYDIKEALESYIPDNNRSQIKQTAKNRLFLDCYNANPTSMAAAIEGFASVADSHKIVMLGEMKELGVESSVEHKRLLDNVLSKGFERVILVGAEFEFAKGTRCVEWFKDSAEAKTYFAEHPIADSSILIKGSNSNRMALLEEVL